MTGTRRLGWVIVGLALATLVRAQSDNPAMPGFDAEGSDAKAIEIADEVMEALGGPTSLGRHALRHLEVLRQAHPMSGTSTPATCVTRTRARSCS